MMNVERWALVLLLGVAACSKPDTAKPEAADAGAAPPDNTFRITAAAPPNTAPAAMDAAPTPLGTAPIMGKDPVATSTATAKAPAAGAKPSATPAVASAEPPALKGAASHVSGKNFTLDVSSPGCRVDTPCAVTLRIAAVGDYHVNKEYPYKFIATPAAGVAFLGNGDANTFSRAAGDFHEDGEKTGTMTVRLKPSAAGSANVSGTYKMSICSADQCQIEAQPVSLAVPVM